MSSDHARAKSTTATVDFRETRAVFLDVGNTLLEPHPSVETVCSRVLASHGYQIGEERLVAALELADQAYEERYWQDDTFWSREVDTGAFWTSLYELMLKEVGLDGDAPAIAKEIYEAFGRGQSWKPYDDVLPALRALSGAGYKLGLISNWDTRLPTLAVETGMSPYLDFVISSACVGMLKPQPGIFDLALVRAKVTAAQAVHVGDHYYADVMGARTAGITPILIDRKNKVDQADCVVVSSLAELPGLLAT